MQIILKTCAVKQSNFRRQCGNKS